jgi:HD-GYP domain-containing protein (c-di-GMP phosphodiesterase class II)
VKISSIVNKITSFEESKNLYNDTLSLIKEVLKDGADYRSVDLNKITAQAEKLIEQQTIGNKALLMLVFSRNLIDQNYLFCHAVNVCIYSIEVGLGLGYERPALIELGVAALFYDIGMTKYLDIVSQPRKLTPQEYAEIKNHSVAGALILERINGLSKSASLLARQHHERIDGSGYPEGLKAQAMNEYAKILSIVDVYEAMTHVRFQRDRHASLDTVRDILNNKDKFDQGILKIFIDRIGIFAVGSIVRLSTKEIAQIIRLNPGIPLRPVVQIICDTNGYKLSETKILDLLTQPTVYIKGEERINVQ